MESACLEVIETKMSGFNNSNDFVLTTDQCVWEQMVQIDSQQFCYLLLLFKLKKCMNA